MRNRKFTWYLYGGSCICHWRPSDTTCRTYYCDVITSASGATPNSIYVRQIHTCIDAQTDRPDSNVERTIVHSQLSEELGKVKAVVSEKEANATEHLHAVECKCTHDHIYHMTT